MLARHGRSEALAVRVGRALAKRFLEEEPMKAKSILALALLAVGGCASIPEHDPVLANARVAVYAARDNPQVVTYARGELNQAVITLREADDLAARGGSLSEVHRLADLAQQRAAAAQESARLRIAEAAQRAAGEARLQADLSRQQAEAAQTQAAAAQRRAEEAQRQAAAVQVPAPPGVVVQPSLADIGAQQTSRGVVVTLTDAMFERGGAQVTPDAMYDVQRLAAYLVAHPERRATIEGFSDDSGNRYLDRRLSEERALAVQSALVSLGVDSRRITVHGYGDSRPLASNSTTAGRQINRRVEVVIL